MQVAFWVANGKKFQEYSTASISVCILQATISRTSSALEAAADRCSHKEALREFVCGGHPWPLDMALP